MCWHKWSKWGEIQQREMKSVHYDAWRGTQVGEPTIYLENFQQRTCSKCNKIQENVIVGHEK